MTEYEILSLVFQVLILIVSIVTVTSSVILSILSTKKDYPNVQDKQSFLDKHLAGVILPSAHHQYITIASDAQERKTGVDFITYPYYSTPFLIFSYNTKPLHVDIFIVSLPSFNSINYYTILIFCDF